MFGVTSRQSSINTEPEMSENEGMRDVIHYVNKLQDRAVNKPSQCPNPEKAPTTTFYLLKEPSLLALSQLRIYKDTLSHLLTVFTCFLVDS